MSWRHFLHSSNTEMKFNIKTFDNKSCDVTASMRWGGGGGPPAGAERAGMGEKEKGVCC